jgi:hypothetical protein
MVPQLSEGEGIKANIKLVIAGDMFADIFETFFLIGR